MNVGGGWFCQFLESDLKTSLSRKLTFKGLKGSGDVCAHPPLDTFSIVTTEANELTDPIHDRMPVILHPRDYDRWLNDYDESRPPLGLLRPYESEGMTMTPANRAVGNVRNNGAAMLNSA